MQSHTHTDRQTDIHPDTHRQKICNTYVSSTSSSSIMTRPASTLALETHVLVVNEFTDTDAGVDAVVVEEEGAAKEAALAVAWVNSEEERGEERVEVLLRV